MLFKKGKIFQLNLIVIISNKIMRLHVYSWAQPRSIISPFYRFIFLKRRKLNHIPKKDQKWLVMVCSAYHVMSVQNNKKDNQNKGHLSFQGEFFKEIRNYGY